MAVSDEPMNRAQRRKAKVEKVDFNKKATEAAQTLLDAAAIMVKGIKGGVDPTHLEVYGLAGIILKDVYEELMEEMVKKDETKPDTDVQEKAV